MAKDAGQLRVAQGWQFRSEKWQHFHIGVLLPHHATLKEVVVFGVTAALEKWHVFNRKWCNNNNRVFCVFVCLCLCQLPQIMKESHTFHDIMKCYRSQPQASSHVGHTHTSTHENKIWMEPAGWTVACCVLVRVYRSTAAYCYTRRQGSRCPMKIWRWIWPLRESVRSHPWSQIILF